MAPLTGLQFAVALLIVIPDVESPDGVEHFVPPPPPPPPFGPLIIVFCALTPKDATTKSSRANNLIRILNFERFKNLRAVQFTCTIIKNQAANNEYDANKNTKDLFLWVLIDHNQFFTLRTTYYPQNKEFNT